MLFRVFLFHPKRVCKAQKHGVLLQIEEREWGPQQVERLLKLGANPNTRDEYGYTPLFHMPWWIHVDAGDYVEDTEVENIVALLLKYGADPNVQGEKRMTPLFRAYEMGSVTSIKALLAHGAKPDVQVPYI